MMSLPSPGFQTNTSLPAPPNIASWPRPPVMMSSPGVPVRVSGSLVPLMMAMGADPFRMTKVTRESLHTVRKRRHEVAVVPHLREPWPHRPRRGHMRHIAVPATDYRNVQQVETVRG